MEGNSQPQGPLDALSSRALQGLPLGGVRPEGGQWQAVDGVGQPQGRGPGQEGDRWANGKSWDTGLLHFSVWCSHTVTSRDSDGMWQKTPGSHLANMRPL